jgi:hypothetical protein
MKDFGGWLAVNLFVLLLLPCPVTAQHSSGGSGTAVSRMLNIPFDAGTFFGRAAGPGIIAIDDESVFQAGSGAITFSEFGPGTLDPLFTPAVYGGAPGDPVVSTGGYFAGQRLGNNAGECPPGAALSGCVVGTPSNPLNLDVLSPSAFIDNDDVQPNTPVLTGTPLFNGPVAVRFDKDVAAVGLRGGFFDALGSTAITAFARDGSALGAVTNPSGGVKFYGVATSDGTNAIAGVLVSFAGNEPTGYTVDDLRFARNGQVAMPAPGKPQLTVRGGFLKFDTTGGAVPDSADCSDSSAHPGRMIVDEINNLLYVCTDPTGLSPTWVSVGLQ